MTKDQRRAADFAQLATIHGRDGEAVSRAVIEKMEPAARDELYAMAHALTGALKAGPNGAAPRSVVDTGIRSPSSPTGIMEQCEPTNDPTPMAGDAIPRLRRISRG